MGTIRLLAALGPVFLSSACCLEISSNGTPDTTTASTDRGGNTAGTSSSATGRSGTAGASAASTTTTGASSAGSSGTTGEGDAGPWDVTTLVGNEEWGSQDGTDGPNGTAQFAALRGIAVDGSGTIFLSGENGIRKIDPQGNVTTLVAAGPKGPLIDPGGITLDAVGDVLVSDSTGNTIQKLDRQGVLTTIAGNGKQGWFDGTGGANGTAEFNGPAALAVDRLGNVYVADEQNDRIRKIDTDGNVTTVAGNGEHGSADGTGGVNGTAQFDGPYGLAIDGDGNLFTADFGGYRIRKIDPQGHVTTLAGNGLEGYADGTGGRNGAAEFVAPEGLAFDREGNLLVADDWGDRIREIDSAGNVTTFAGSGVEGTTDGLTGPEGTAMLYDPKALAVDSKGNVYDIEGGTPGRVRVFKRP